jgi:hypothetical protein
MFTMLALKVGDYVKTLEVGPRVAGKASEFILNQFNFDRIHAANI